MFSERADGLRASKRKWSPSPSPPVRSKSPKTGSSHKRRQVKQGAEASKSTSQGSARPPTENAAAAFAGPSNTVYEGAKAPASEPSATVTSGAHAQPQPMMIGFPPNGMPEGAPCRGVTVPKGVEDSKQAALDLKTSQQTAEDNETSSKHNRPEIPAYYLARRRGPRKAWNAGAGAERDENAFSKHPGSDFEVLRMPFDSVSSTGGRSDRSKEHTS